MPQRVLDPFELLAQAPSELGVLRFGSQAGCGEGSVMLMARLGELLLGLQLGEEVGWGKAAGDAPSPAGVDS